MLAILPHRPPHRASHRPYSLASLNGRTESDLIAIGEIVRNYANRLSQMLGAAEPDD